MAEVAVLKSRTRFGNCRALKGITAEGAGCANGYLLGLRRICVGLSSFDGVLTGGYNAVALCRFDMGYFYWKEE